MESQLNAAVVHDHSVVSCIPWCNDVREIFHAEPEQLTHIQQVILRNSTPNKWGLGAKGKEVRHTVLGVIIDRATLNMIVVQNPNGPEGQFAPVQGPMKGTETVYKALRKQGILESGLTLSREHMHYVGSALCPAPDREPKAPRYSSQLFHCMVAYANLTGKEEFIWCERSGAFATVLHAHEFWSCFRAKASDTKQLLVKQVLQEAITRELIPEPMSLQ